MMKKILLGGSLLALAAAGPAEAASFVWGFGDGVNAASGTLTTTDSPTDPVTITGITGFYNGAAITALMPAGSFGNNNNRLYPNSATYLDVFGFTFLAAGIQQNIYYYNSAYRSFRDDQAGSFSLRAASGGVPEPSTWAMLLTGFLAIGGAMRTARRKQRLTISYG
jgi:hypothetical protein